MTHVWGGGWDLVFVPLGPLGKMAMQWGVKTRQILAEFVHGPERDNHCDFFSPGKTNHYKPTKEEKSLTIYAQVQKSGVSSILSLSRVDLSCFLRDSWPVHLVCLTLMVLHGFWSRGN